MKGPVIVRWLVVAIAGAGVAVFAQWMWAHPVENPVRRNFYPLFVELTQRALMKGTGVGIASLWLIAVAGALSSALALFLALKARGNPATLRLSVALGASALAVAYFYFLVPYPIAGIWAGPGTPVSALLALDSLGYVLWVLGMWFLVRFFQIFPQPVSQADWERNVSVFLDANRDIYGKGWRRWAYPQKFNDPAYWEGLETRGGLQRLIARGRSARDRTRLHQLVQSRGAFLVLCGAAVAAALAQYAIRLQLPGLPEYQKVPVVLVMLSTLIVWFVGVGAASLAYAYLQFHRKWGSDDDRRRVGWINSTVFVAGVLFIGVFQGAFAVFILLVLFAVEALPAEGFELLLLAPLLLGPPLFALACIASLVISVFYRGAIDPRHAARKVTLWGLLSILITVAFVVLERVITVKVTQWLAMPPETGPLVAGALVAATITPIRGRAETMTNGLVSRFLPVDSIAGGEKREAAIALSDLSGYTALADRDEKQALLLAALLQQRAARVAASHAGRVVKSMGDAVLFEFSDAPRSCAALLELHANFADAALALGFVPLPLHSGAHWGEVTVGPDGDVYGQTVNLAARLLGEAEEGQVIVSEALASAADVPPSRLRILGHRSLKNVQAPVLCHELLSREFGA